MPIWLRNFQRCVSFNEHMLKMRCCFLLNALGAGRFDTSVVCVDNKRMRRLNSTYCNQDTPTDVLSFPYHEVYISLIVYIIIRSQSQDLKPGSRLPIPERECDYNLGDIILNVPYINTQCIQERVELMDRLTVSNDLMPFYDCIH